MVAVWGFDGLFRDAERRVRFALFCVACTLAMLFSQSAASAAPVAGKAISSLPAGDPTYFYMDFEDADGLAARLQKSELLRLLIDQEPGFESLRQMLRNLPAKDIALLLSFDGESEFRFQMAWSFKDDRRAVLSKIAKQTATAEEVLGLLGLPADSRLLQVKLPGEEEPFYNLDPWNLHVSARDDVLIFGDSPESVSQSAVAAGSRMKRFTPRTEGKGRNRMLFSMSSNLTAEIVKLYDSFHDIERKDAAPERLLVEGDIELVPGGWNLDVFTNAVAVVYGSEFAESLYAKPEGSFYSAGGGRLLAAIDSTPNLRQILNSGYAPLFGAPLATARERLYEVLSTAVGDEEVKRLTDELLSIDRLNLAVTHNPENPANVRAYTVLSSRTGSMDAVSDAVAKLVSKYQSEAKKGKQEEIEIDESGANGWKTVYSFKAPSEKNLPAGSDQLVVALDKNRILAGVLSPSLLTVPFNTDSAVYSDLTKGDTRVETFYFDVRNLRKTVRAFVDAKKMARRGRTSLALIMIPFVDFHEIGGEAFSASHIRFKFRTGWLDFDDRAFIDALMK